MKISAQPRTIFTALAPKRKETRLKKFSPRPRGKSVMEYFFVSAKIFVWLFNEIHTAQYFPLKMSPNSWTHSNDFHKIRGQGLNSTNFVDTLLSPFFVEFKKVFQEQD